jgi:hypothetical protein
MRYSDDVPRLELEEVVACLAFWSGAAGWSDSAVIQSVEFPGNGVSRVGGRLPNGERLGFGERARAWQCLGPGELSLPHVLDATADSIPQRHRLAVAFAAHLLCQQLATRFAGDRETTLGSDMSRTESRSRNYAARAKDYRAAYFAGIGQLDPALQDAVAGSAVSAVVSWPRRNRVTVW